MPSSSSPSDEILLEIRGKIAIITLNRPDVLNALDMKLYYRLASLMRDVAENPDVYVTVLTGWGRYFSAGADVTSILPPSSSAVEPHREQTLRSFVANNLFITHAFYTHPKILITALNGPAIGLSAALIAHSDFIYAAPHAFILTPFTSLGLVAEGGASRAFVKRLGIAKANEALIMSKRIGVEELVGCGFVNGIIESTDTETEETKSSSRGSKSKSKSKSSLPSSSPPSSPSSPPSSSPDSNSDRASQSQSQSQSTKFLDLVLKEIEKKLLGGHLNSTSLLEMKALIRKPDEAVMGSQTVAEVLSGLKRFETRVPYEEFGKVRGGSKRHKL